MNKLAVIVVAFVFAFSLSNEHIGRADAAACCQKLYLNETDALWHTQYFSNCSTSWGTIPTGAYVELTDDAEINCTGGDGAARCCGYCQPEAADVDEVNLVCLDSTTTPAFGPDENMMQHCLAAAMGAPWPQVNLDTVCLGINSSHTAVVEMVLGDNCVNATGPSLGNGTATKQCSSEKCCMIATSEINSEAFFSKSYDDCRVANYAETTLYSPGMADVGTVDVNVSETCPVIVERAHCCAVCLDTNGTEIANYCTDETSPLPYLISTDLSPPGGKCSVTKFGDSGNVPGESCGTLLPVFVLPNVTRGAGVGCFNATPEFNNTVPPSMADFLTCPDLTTPSTTGTGAAPVPPVVPPVDSSGSSPETIPGWAIAMIIIFPILFGILLFGLMACVTSR